MVVTQKQVDHALHEISIEKKKLENYNDELAKNVASTQALKAVKRQLERNNKILRERLNKANDQANANSPYLETKNVNEMYNIEINKLQDYLEIIKNKKESAAFELRQAKIDNANAKDQYNQAEAHIEKLRVDLENERRIADSATQKYQVLSHEVENLSNICEFNRQIYEAKLSNLRAQLLRNQTAQDIYEEATNEGHQLVEVDIKAVLTIFRNEYQEILDKAYHQERNELINEINILEKKLSNLDEISNSQKGKISYYQSELNRLNDQKLLLERDCTELTSKALNETNKFEQSRDELLSNIKKTTKAIRKMENDLDSMIREDNEAVKLIIQLQLEINAYKTLMEIENVYDDPNSVIVEDNISRFKSGEIMDVRLSEV